MMSLLLGLVLSQDPFLEEIEREPGRVRFSVVATARLSFISGDLGQGGVDYADNFEYGYGAALEADLLFGMPYGWWLGPYVTLAADRYEGDSFGDVFGTRVSPDDLDVRSVFAGVRSDSLLGPYWLVSGRLGVGRVRYDDVEADISEFGVARPGREFLESTSAWGFEAVGNFQYGSPQVRWHIGAAFGFQGGPKEGDDAEDLLDTEEVWVFRLETGLVVRF